ncbi:MAG: D-alanine--D-alanine ligase [Coriobacteriales bacterium]|jgi:D-alanine-D-alanine ligase|nr:D-alanine--D-alanine ligase [Coriobacteriales bacterium]
MSVTDTKVCVLAGGCSSEREVSLQSGANVSAILGQAGFNLCQLDPRDHDFIEALRAFAPDVCFIALHGRGGEDGTIQGLLELLGIPYTGCNVLSSALAMDKLMTKQIYRQNQIPTPAYQLSPKGLSFPCVFKPADQGSSVGIRILREVSEVDPGAAGFYEDYVSGTEVTVAVLGTAQPRVLPIIEIRPRHAFYDFDSKYAEGGSDHIIPAQIAPAAQKRCSELALAVHQALGCRDLSRTDMIIDHDGQVWVIETNTIPGMTDKSLVPDAARAAGITPSQLYRQMIEWALARKGA